MYYTVQNFSIPYSLQCTALYYTVQCCTTQYSAVQHSTVYTCAVYILQCRVCSAQCTVYINCMQCTARNYTVQCCTTQYSVCLCSVQCTVYCVQCTVCCVQCAVYNVLCTVCCIQCTDCTSKYSAVQYSPYLCSAVIWSIIGASVAATMLFWIKAIVTCNIIYYNVV